MSKKENSRKLFQKTKYFWVYFIIAALGGTLGVFLMPIWAGTTYFWRDWGAKLLNLILFALLVVYIFLYFIPRIRGEGKKDLHTLRIVETCLLMVLALLCLLAQFGIVGFMSPCFAFGIVAWLRGCFYIIEAYLFDGKRRAAYPLFLLILALGLVTFGTFLFLRPIPGNHFLWLISLAILVLSCVALLMGFFTKPKAKKKAASKEEE